MKVPVGFLMIVSIIMFLVAISFKMALKNYSTRLLARVIGVIVLLLDFSTIGLLSPQGRELVKAHLAGEMIPQLVQYMVAFFMAQLLFTVFVFIGFLIRWTERKLKMPVSESRRGFLRSLFGLPTLAIGASAYASCYEKDLTIVRKVAVPTKGLPSSFYGFRIAQLSDIHIGMFFSLEKLKNLMERTASLGAEALLLTGDIFDDRSLNEEVARIIDSYTDRFPKGIYFVYGNHEHFRGFKKIGKILEKTKIKLLNNRNELVMKGERPLYFLGVDYPMERHAFDTLALSYLDDAFKNVPENAVTVLLTHHPDFIDLAAERSVNLVTAGHTHGGQIGLMGIPLVPPVYKYMRGAYNVKDTFAYVHSGNGSWFPYRLGCPPEIALFTLCEEG